MKIIVKRTERKMQMNIGKQTAGKEVLFNGTSVQKKKN